MIGVVTLPAIGSRVREVDRGNRPVSPVYVVTGHGCPHVERGAPSCPHGGEAVGLAIRRHQSSDDWVYCVPASALVTA